MRCVRICDLYLVSAIGQYEGKITLPRIADIYETLGRYLDDLGQLNQVSALIYS